MQPDCQAAIGALGAARHAALDAGWLATPVEVRRNGEVVIVFRVGSTVGKTVVRPIHASEMKLMLAMSSASALK
jgi:hypothetical protein